MRIRFFVFSSVFLCALAAAACGADKSGPNTVEVVVHDTAIEIPATLKPGFTTFKIAGESDGDNHLIFVHAHTGVSLDQLKGGIAANDGSGDSLVTIVGGNGGMPNGSEADVTFELKEGNYGVALYGGEGDLAASSYFTVHGNGKAPAPKADGTIALGPGLVFSLPAGFDGKGTYEVVNKDGETHEAAFVRLADGQSVDDAKSWAASGFEGPPPFEPAGGFGALDGGERGWIQADLKPGKYAIICWIPGDDGVPHWVNGMSAPFTVN